MKRRILNNDERQLWQRVTEGVKSLHPPHPSSNTEHPAPVSRKRKTYVPSVKTHAPIDTLHKPAHRQPLSEAGDPRLVRHVRRGRREIDDIIDLHGMKQDQAYTALTRFIVLSRSRGNRILLVITGKGVKIRGHEDNSYSVSRGILRERFVQWAEGHLRHHIAGIKQAHQRHGGSGAYYVFLKKPESR